VFKKDKLRDECLLILVSLARPILLVQEKDSNEWEYDVYDAFEFDGKFKETDVPVIRTTH
jgi:hypothetical protein